LSASRPIVAVLATMNTKSKEARFIASALQRTGVTPWILDLSMKPHNLSVAVSAELAGVVNDFDLCQVSDTVG